MFSQNGLSLRTVFWGVLFTLGAALSCPYVVINIQPAGLAADYITAGAILELFILVLLINPFLGFFNRRFMLREEEMITIYSMALVASAIPSWGIILNLIPLLSGLTYYATPENRWAELILPHVKPWLLPPASVAAGFFEGLPKGQPIPYAAWFKPLGAWLIFFFLMFLFSLALINIFRKQWMENEHLTFPLTILPAEMMSRAEGAVLPDLFKKKLFWLGFGISFLAIFINGLSFHFLIIPPLHFAQTVYIFRNTSYIIFFFSFPILGLAYLLNLDVLFSLWFFELLAICESGWFNISGYSLPGHNETSGAFSAATTFQGFGAMLVLVIFLIWRARRHLTIVFKHAFQPRGNPGGEMEMLTYRQSVWILIISFLGMLGWLIATGMNPLVSSFFLISAFVIILGLTMIVCQAGVGFLRSPCTPGIFTAYSLPASHIGNAGYASLGLQSVWTSDIRTSVMASAANSLKLTEGKPKLRRLSFFLLLIFAAFLAYISSAWLVLKSGYLHGALNSSNGWFFGDLPPAVGNFIKDKILNPPTPQIIHWRLIFTGIGAFFMFFLVVMHSKFAWWPIHYIGFPIIDTWMAVHIWLPALIAWLIKGLILRYGGPKVYRQGIPLFLGFVLGPIIAAGLWMVIDFFTHTIGNTLIIGVG